ncbi:MAG: histidine phosphatase family protein [Fusobacteriaceae bacterium]
MGKLILIRHGETEYNKQKLFFGWKDPELNEMGISQSNKAKERLKKYEYDKIYVSPLKRAFLTGEIVNYKELELNVSNQLKELNFGIFEGHSYEEILEKYPDEEKNAKENWKDYSFETGESPKMLQERVIEFINSNLNLETENVVLVTHWGVICTILSHYITGGLNGYWKFKIKNGGIAVLEFSEGFVSLEGLNVGE